MSFFVNSNHRISNFFQIFNLKEIASSLTFLRHICTKKFFSNIFRFFELFPLSASLYSVKVIYKKFREIK